MLLFKTMQERDSSIDEDSFTYFPELLFSLQMFPSFVL